MIGVLTLGEIASALGVLCYRPDSQVTGVTTDSRDITVGCVFVAIRGERFDGHDFIPQVLQSGAIAVVCESTPTGYESACFSVNDSVQAYGIIARINRRRFTGYVIGITGSAGKTSTRVMLATILSQDAPTHSSEKNYNNEIGVARSLLSLSEDRQYSVLEFGARKPKNIAWLSTIAEPDCGLIINIAEAHLETFGSLQGVAQTKGELFAALPESGTALVNGDDSCAEQLSQRTTARTYSFSLDNPAANCYLSDVYTNDGSMVFRFHLSIDGVQWNASAVLHMTGKHYLYNACASILAAAVAGCPVEAVVAGLAAFTPVSGRQNTYALSPSIQLIDDSYNANPASVRAAIDSLVEDTKAVSIFVLGDMLELGKNTKQLHQEIGRYASDKGVDLLMTMGTLAGYAAQEFNQTQPGMASSFMDHQSLADVVSQTLELSAKKIHVLVKGSRSMTMERVIEYIGITNRSSIQAQGEEICY